MLVIVMLVGLMLSNKVASQNNSTKIPSHSYQVTENVIDVPDERTLPPIEANYGILTPLNIANSSIKRTHYNSHNGTKPHNVSNSTINKNATDKNDTTPNTRKNSFSLLHIKVEADECPGHETGGIGKVFTGIKDYFHNIRKGVVDGIHKFFHKNNDKIDGQWRSEPHGDDGDEKFERERYNDDYDDDFKHEFDHY